MGTDHSGTLLTIEDDHIVRKAIAAYLERLGYLVHQAADGTEGLTLFRRIRPDLVLTDLRLPHTDGLEVLSAIRNESPDTSVIIVSGMGTVDDVIKALKLGAQDYVTKPITDMALLAHAIDQALERARLIRENRKYQSYLEDEIQKRTAELYQAQKHEALGTLAGGIAHDFNNILAAIMGFTELALLKVEKNSPVEQDLLQIKKASDRARDLVLHILTFSRRTTTQRQPLQIAPVVKEVLKLLRATLPATVDLRQNISAGKAMIVADPTEIHQIITNLCTNSFHALENEQGSISVALNMYTVREESGESLSELAPGDYLRLSIGDDGCGMEKSVLDKIFDPFFTTKEKGRGTGLGLSIVHGIVKECGGTISVESTPERGTTFTLLFPVVEAEPEIETEGTGLLPGGNERILFVDDEKELRTLTGQMLTYLGYHVTCCPSGQEALKKLTETPGGFNLLITDQSMPLMPGTELVSKVRAINPDLPVLLCTGHSSMIDEKKAEGEGISGFLMKPIAFNNLARKIRKILDRQLSKA